MKSSILRLLRATAVVACFSPTLLQAAEKPAPPTPTAADVSYGPHPHQILDIYVPPDSTEPCPVLIWYGGLWQPSKHAVDLNRFFPSHIAVVAVESRTLADGVQEKANPPISYPMTDACRAVQFIRLHAAKWNLDPKRIVVGGGSQGTLPALYVGCAGDQANAASSDPVEQVSTKVVGVAAYRSQPTIDPQRMQEWVPGVAWGAPAFGCSFEESLKRREELLPVIQKWSPDWLLHKEAAPIYFENEWGMTQPADFTEANYKVHSPAWGMGFQKLAQTVGATVYNKFPDHPTEKYKDIWDFIVQSLKEPAKWLRGKRASVRSGGNGGHKFAFVDGNEAPVFARHPIKRHSELGAFRAEITLGLTEDKGLGLQASSILQLLITDVIATGRDPVKRELGASRDVTNTDDF